MHSPTSDIASLALAEQIYRRDISEIGIIGINNCQVDPQNRQRPESTIQTVHTRANANEAKNRIG